MGRKEETEERRARRDERKLEEGRRRGQGRKETRSINGGEWRRPEHGHEGTKKKICRRGKRRERREGRGGRVSGARSLSDTLRRTDALLRSPLVAQKRV